jgi:glycosyltransferase involved in cell wall biosynthesis
VSAARNTGMEHAQGRYIQFIDSDDLVKSGTFRQLYFCAENNHADVVYFNMDFLNDEASHLVRTKEDNKCIDGVKTGREMFCLHQQSGIPKMEACRQFIRRDYLMESNINFYEGIRHEDILFSFLVAMTAGRTVDLNDELYIYRQRSDSNVWSEKNKSASSWFVCLVNMCSYWLSHDFSENENKWIAYCLKNVYDTFTYHMCYQENGNSVGGYKEKAIYDMIFAQHSFEIAFEEKDIAILRKSPINILYGAGKIGYEVFEILKRYNISINYVAVSDTKGNASSMNGVAVKGIDELLDYRNAVVILGTDEKWHGEMIAMLEKLGFYHYIKPKKEKVTN